MMLATDIDGRIVATDLCKTIAADPGSVDPDEYLAHFARRFYYPSPVFEHYDPIAPQVFPVVGIVKLLISRFLADGKNKVSLAEIAGHLIANDVTGLEDLDFYGLLEDRPHPAGADLRQVRELVKVISQFSFLKWVGPNLHIETKSRQELFAIEKAVQPIPGIRQSDPAAEIMAMGSGFPEQAFGPSFLEKPDVADEGFVEGKKVRRTHVIAERSAKLKQMYFSVVTAPDTCDMCSMDTCRRYPWTARLIELHHLLPLASPIRVETAKTSVKDLVGLCPSCHRATHRYYSNWLKKSGLPDFRTYAEARGVYGEARAKIVLAH